MRNPYKLLRELIPEPPLLVGTVAAIADGTARITMPDGNLALARGSATVGDRVFFRDGRIEGSAPALTVEVIEI